MKPIGSNKFLSRALAVVSAVSTAVIIASPRLGHATGAVSGGGGGTLPADPVSIWQVERVVKEGFREMRLIAREMSRRQFRGTESALDLKLFSGPKTLVDVLDETGYEVRNDKPCLDRHGNEVDASIFANHPDDICISAFRIAPKLIEERLRIETLALVFHELSHKLGTTEAEAIKLQKEAAFFLGQGDPKSLDLPVARMFYEYASGVKSKLDQVADSFEKKNTTGISNSVLKKQVDQLFANVISFGGAIRPGAPYSYYTRRQFEYVEWLEIRLEILRYTLMAKFDDQPDYWNRRIDETFNGAAFMTYGDFLRSESPSSYSGNDFESNLLVRLDSDSQVIDELRSLEAAFKLESDFLFQFGPNLALHKHAADGLDQIFNPFVKFIGKYKLSDVVCTSSNYKNPEGRMPLEIELSAGSSGHPGEVDLRKSWPSMHMTDLLRENGTAVLGGTVLRLSGSETPTSRSAESLGVFGTPWGDRYDRQIIRIEERSDGLYYVDSYQTRQRTARGPWESTYHCEARL